MHPNLSLALGFLLWLAIKAAGILAGVAVFAMLAGAAI